MPSGYRDGPTTVNRKRVESAELEDGDELQIGKYRLTFLRH